MEKAEEIVLHGLKRLELIKSFRLGVRSLLTAFPFEDFYTSSRILARLSRIASTSYIFRTNIKLVKQDLLAAKKSEILLLQDLLDKVEDEKHSIKASVTTDAVEKLRSMMANYSNSNGRQ